jgi:hypothetical protein
MTTQNADESDIVLSLSHTEMAMIVRAIAYIHECWNSEALIVTDFDRDDYSTLRDTLMRKWDEGSVVSD